MSGFSSDATLRTSVDGQSQNVSLAPSSTQDYNSSSVETTTAHLHPPLPIDIQYYVIETLIGVTAVVGNALVLWLILGKKGFRKGHQSNMYFASLAVADFFVGLLVCPFALLNSIGFPRHYQLCLFMQSTLLLLSASSIYSCAVLSLDRFLAVVKPLRYKEILTRRRAQALIAMSWILAGIVGLLPLMGWNLGVPPVPRCLFVEIIDFKYLAFFFFIAIVPASIVTAVFYAMIFVSIKKQVKSQESLRLRNGSISAEQNNTSRRWKREVRIAKVLFVIVVFFFICWYPLFLFDTVAAFKTVGFPGIGILVNALVYLSHANSAANPILYGFASKDFRDAYYETIQQLFCCHTRVAPQSQEGSSTSGGNTAPGGKDVKKNLTQTEDL